MVFRVLICIAVQKMPSTAEDDLYGISQRRSSDETEIYSYRHDLRGLLCPG